MKKKMILLLALIALVIFTFAGCRKVGSDVNSAVSDVVSKVESAGNTVGSAVSGAVSGAQSKLESAGSAVGSAVSGAVSGVQSAVSGAQSQSKAS